MLTLTRAWERFENPVLGREFRSRFRGARSYVITGVYTLLVGAIFLIVYGATVGSLEDSLSQNAQAARIGRGVWLAGCITQAILLPLTAPAFTCGAITMERERSMLELLLLTRLSAWQIAVGKFTSGTGQALMLLLASAPVLALSFLLGGVAPEEMGAALLVLATTILFAGSLGLYASTLAHKTRASIVLAYLVMGYQMIVIPICQAMLESGPGSSDPVPTVQQLGGALGLTLPGVALLIALWTALPSRHREARSSPWLLAIGGLATWGGLLILVSVVPTWKWVADQHFGVTVHPALVIAISAERSGGIPVAQIAWAICSGVQAVLAILLFLISVVRIHRLRS